ncbi:hypothetical protein [Candidatus Desulforudis audaxviator]|nr:hypothetical protein [Candidatus Desulforudis audaxviator]AZK58891.1 hypothetical protein Daudx_0335 [Candidatus Desulforudis audaxviator]
MSADNRTLFSVYNRISGRSGLLGRRAGQVRAVVNWFARRG